MATLIRLTMQRDIWRPFLRNNEPALIVVGQGTPPLPDGISMNPLPTTLSTEVEGPRNQIQTANAVAAAEICGVLRQFNRTCNIAMARTTTFAQLHQKSVVLVGAFDNPWTEHLLVPLRFHFDRQVAIDHPQGRVLAIVDRDRKASGSPWVIDAGISPDQMKSDYLIIARFHSDTIDDDVLVAAGIWTHGTQSAGEYVASRDKVAKLLSLAPAAWDGFNFEAVLRTDIVNGEPGDVKIVATEFW